MKLRDFNVEDIQGKIDYLINEEYHLLTLEEGLTPKDYFVFISNLSSICHHTALSFAMHLYTLWGLKLLLPDRKKVNKYINSVLNEGSLLASLNEPGLYFVSPDKLREKDFNIIASPVKGGYILNGVKNFISMEPLVTYLPMYCRIENYQEKDHGIIVVIVNKNTQGINIKKNWDSISMEHTESNSVELNNVFVSSEDVLLMPSTSISQTDLFGYLFRLSISSVYYGIAKSATEYIKNHTVKHKVPHFDKPLAFFPGSQYSIAEMIIKLETSYSQIIQLCEALQSVMDTPISYESKKEIKKISLITKEYSTQSAKEIVDTGLKIVGVKSLSKKNYLSELYKDVIAGQFHPPQRDIAYELLAKDFVGILPWKNRW
ncbi:acyl-CoA dehydrogenase family protein [Bacillus sp. SM2101]|uniref:acyl-CoA dehydrogenase family protein n=1 Tax=Bacillus sp. SM2101 TaxID=2805366 RepID=UPI001BDF1068|nr:acyl-CoA dehydrogenase family protein [Bacillus sp. SM2101]